MTLNKFADDEIKIVLGRDQYSVYELELDLTGGYFSISGNDYDVSAFDEEEGERRAQEYLDDGEYKELWKSAVQADSTEQSYDDWKEDVLNQDGWQQVLGDIQEICYNDKFLYFNCSGGGQNRNSLDELTDTRLSNKEIEIIKNAWDKLHLKKLTEIYDHPRFTKLLNQCLDVFLKYQIVDRDQEIGQYLDI